MGKYSDKSLKVSRKYLLHAKFEVAERIWFYLIPTAQGRVKWLRKHKKLAMLGEHVHWQPRKYPTDGNMLKVHDNVAIASNVEFTMHDARKKILDYLHPPLIEKPVNQKPSLHQMEHYQKFYENGEYVRAVESTTEQNYNMIDGCANNLPKPRIINGRESVLDKLRIRQMAREKQKSGQMQEQSTDIERNRK